MSTVRKRVIVSGVVQGVFFRQSTRQVAEAAGACGWVRNLIDGEVEAVIEGPDDAVDDVVRFCHSGPNGARVDSVEVFDEVPEGLTGFAIWPTPPRAAEG